MAILLFWALPAAIVVGRVGRYLVTVAEIMDAALALAIPTKIAPDRRRTFKIIQGGRT
jgi:hypothetical protein